MGKPANNCASSLVPITLEQDEERERILLGGMPHPPVAMTRREEIGQGRGDDIEREEESLLPREYSPTSGWRTPRELKERGWEQSPRSQVFFRARCAPSCDGSSNQDGEASSRSRFGDWSCEALPPPLKFTSMSLDKAASKMRAGGRRWLSKKGGFGSGSACRTKAPVPTGLLRHLAFDSPEGSSRKMLGPWTFFVNSVAGRAANQSMAMALSAWKQVVMAGKVEAESAQCALHGIDLPGDVGGATTGGGIQHASGSPDPIHGSELAGSHREAAENRQGMQPCIAQARADKTEFEGPSKLSRESKTVSWRDGRGRPAYSHTDILAAEPAASFAPRGTVHAVAGVSHYSELKRGGHDAGMFSLSLEEDREIKRLLAGGSARESAAGRRSVDAERSASMVPAAFSVTPRAMAYQWHTKNAGSHTSLRVSLVNAGRRQGVETLCADMEDEHAQPLAVPPGPTHNARPRPSDVKTNSPLLCD
jgi:hypothetical protein